MVEIPDDVAKRLAAHLRHEDGYVSVADANRWADLLDPKPPTLREQVAKEVATIVRASMPSLTHDAPEWDAEQADAVLAVVADWLAAQPLWIPGDTVGVCGHQRDHDVRLLCGKHD